MMYVRRRLLAQAADTQNGGERVWKSCTQCYSLHSVRGFGVLLCSQRERKRETVEAALIRTAPSANARIGWLGKHDKCTEFHTLCSLQFVCYRWEMDWVVHNILFQNIKWKLPSELSQLVWITVVATLLLLHLLCIKSTCHCQHS